MPEGDTIFRAARTLHRALAGHVVTRFDTAYAPLARVHDDTPITGRTIEAVEARGKHLVMRFSGNLALRTLATAGLYVGGGIVRHILPAILRNATFMDAFLAKAPMDGLLRRIPVRLILNAETGILGAAVHAQSLSRG